MSKTKNKNRDEVEYLRGQVKQLRKQVKYYKKLTQYMPKIEEDTEEELIEFEKCEECGKGELVTFDFGKIIQTTCSLCDYDIRTKVDD